MKLDRLMGILTILLQKDLVTAPYLANKFEVARRTINRDIDALCQAGIPIVTRQGGRGGISIAEGYKLDKSVLTNDELSSITTALKGLGSVSDKPRIERILDKLNANTDTVVSLKESVVIDLASHYGGSLTHKIELLKRAIHGCKLVQFDYYYEKGTTHRIIEPYFIVFKWTSWYVFGFCQARQDWRLFKLARLWELKEAGPFTPRDIPPDRRAFDTHFTDNYKLKAVFDKSSKYQLIEAYGPGCFTETTDGLFVEIGFTNRSFMLNWLLSFGDMVTILEPAEIAIEIKETAERMLAKYAKTE